MKSPLVRIRVIVAAMAACVVAGLLLSGCSAKRNNAATRKYQAFITRYNIYFNGDEHFKETLKELESTYQDDYSRRLFMHPVEAKADEKAPQPTGSFDRSIEKAQKAIQIRSIKKRPRKQPGKSYDEKYKEWMKRTEYNPFLHNAWMMMGRSQYFNGDFAGAAATFLYVSKHFRWLPATVTEARLWEARCYLAEGWLYEAEVIIVRIKPEELTGKELRRLYHFDYADLLIRSHRYEEAVAQLEALIKLSGGHQKMRLNYLLGQVLSELGRKHEAYEAFSRAGSSSSADYRMQFNARIRRSEVYEGESVEPEIKALRRMVRYDRNKEYLDQVYYAIGNLYMSRRDTTEAVESYRMAVKESTRAGYDKALANLALGNIFFAQHRYDLAQPCMSEAVPALPADFPDIELIKKRSDVLDELAVYAQNVHLQDSLLTLAAMSPEEQMEVCRRMAEDYVKRQKEEEERAKREAYMAEQAANGTPLPDNNVATPMTFGTDDSWYFYNSQAVASGKQAFQKQWGSRKLEDNWRRRNKQEFSMSDFDSDSEGDGEDDLTDGGADALSDEQREAAEEEKRRMAAADNPAEPDYYLKNIPVTDQEKQTANDIVQEGLYNMGLILKDKLEDFDAALAEFDELLKRYPDNIYRLDVYYNLYLMFVRQGDMARADRYRQLILEQFADSPLGQAMKSPDYLANLRIMDERQEALYEQTLQDYLADRNDRVQAGYRQMQEQFPMSKIMPKFMFLNALTYVTDNKPEEFNAALRELLERYPDTDLTPIASAYLKGMAQGRKLHQSSGNMRAMVWTTRLIASGDSTLTDPDRPLVVEHDPSAPQMLALLYDRGRVSPSLLLYEVARRNFSTFVVRDFDLEQMEFGPLGVLLVKGFANERELNHYRRTLAAGGFNFPDGVRPVAISEKNFDTLLKEGRSFDEYFEAIGEKLDLQTHEAVLPPDEYPSPKEMYGDMPHDGGGADDPGSTAGGRVNTGADSYEPSIFLPVPDAVGEEPDGGSEGEDDAWDIPVPEAPSAPIAPSEPVEASSTETPVAEPDEARDEAPERAADEVSEPEKAPEEALPQQPSQPISPVVPGPVSRPVESDEPVAAPEQLPVKPSPVTTAPSVSAPVSDIPEGSEGEDENDSDLF